jgi:hypothetical protein
MKSVLGLIGSAVLAVSCGGISGDALFADVGGAPGAGAAAGARPGGGNTNGGSSSKGGAGATSGGTNQNGGMSGSGTNGGSGTSGTSGDSSGGDGGDTTGPVTPNAIYVATTGNDSADCGLTSADPCQSISQGVARSVQSARPSVYVQAGSYPGVAVLQGGISVVGGFDNNWQVGAHTDAGHLVIIQGGLEAQAQEYVAVWAHDLAESASLQNLEIDAPDAVGQKPGSLDGRSSYGIHAVSAKLSLKDVDIKAGSGAKGADGSTGQDAVATAVVPAMNGSVGGNGVSTVVTCNAEGTLGGPPGTNSCSSSPSTVNMNGGKGGNGGARDQMCTPVNQPQLWNYTAQPGQDGDDAASSPQVGYGGDHGSGGNQCGPTTPGGSGATSNGAKGSKAAGGGKVVSYFWYARAGGDGTTGANGSGGGGGGGGGGCDTGGGGTTDVRGAGGGGGGAGGCAARGGGGGGGGGGSSFGIFAVASSVDVNNVNITRGTAADGGNGGTGGQGQSGGVGEAGGLHPGVAAAAGKGGNGAHGGHGGGGAGGNGGSTYGVALDGTSKLNGAPTTTGGALGKAGSGGASAPNAPNPERDGAAGDDGNDGALAETLDF